MELVDWYGTKKSEKKDIELAGLCDDFTCKNFQEDPNNPKNWHRLIIRKVRKKKWYIMYESGTKVL